MKSQLIHKLPQIIAVKVNNEQVCPENQPTSDGSVCAKFEMLPDEKQIGGRWDGVLTIFPQLSRNGILIGVELDNKAWAMGVNI